MNKKLFNSLLKFLLLFFLFLILSFTTVFAWFSDSYFLGKIQLKPKQLQSNMIIYHYQEQWVNDELVINLGKVNDYSCLPSNYLNYFKIVVLEEGCRFNISVKEVIIEVYDSLDNFIDYQFDYNDINCFCISYFKSSLELTPINCEFSLDPLDNVKLNEYVYLKIEMKLEQTQALYKLIDVMPYKILFKFNLEVIVRTVYE